MERAMKILRILSLVLLVLVTAEWFMLLPRYTQPGRFGIGSVIVGLTPLLLFPLGISLGIGFIIRSSTFIEAVF